MIVQVLKAEAQHPALRLYARHHQQRAQKLPASPNLASYGMASPDPPSAGSAGASSASVSQMLGGAARGSRGGSMRCVQLSAPLALSLRPKFGLRPLRTAQAGPTAATFPALAKQASLPFGELPSTDTCAPHPLRNCAPHPLRKRLVR